MIISSLLLPFHKLTQFEPPHFLFIQQHCYFANAGRMSLQLIIGKSGIFERCMDILFFFFKISDLFLQQLKLPFFPCKKVFFLRLPVLLQ